MYRTILIGYDEQEESLDALALGRLLAAGEDTRIVIGNVHPFSPLPAPGHRSENAAVLLAEAPAGPPGTLALEHRVVLGRSPARGLHRLAGELDADLLVVGSSRYGALGRVLPGDVATAVLREAPCAVAVAPRGLYGKMPQRLRVIGVGYDGSYEARCALPIAARLTRDRGARLDVIGVVVPPGYHGARVGYGYDEFVSMLEVEMRERLDSALALVGNDVSTEARLLRGEPGSVLAAVSDELDLLVVGSRGHGPVRRALLGGVSARVMRLAACPVLVVPRGATQMPGRDDPVRGVTTEAEQPAGGAPR